MSCSAHLNDKFVVDTSHDTLYIIHNSVVGVVNIALALLIIYLLVAHSPSSMRVYRWFLIQLVILCTTQDFMMHIFQPHIILPVLAAYLMVPWPMDSIGVHFAFVFWLILTAQGFCAILDGFYYRERCLFVNFYPNSFWLRTWKEWTAFWHFSGLLIIVIPWPTFDISRDKMRADLEHVTYPNVIGLMNNKSTFLMYTLEMQPIMFPLAIFFAASGLLFTLCACAFSIMKIFWVLRQRGSSLSEKTKRMHSSFTKQLIIQAFVPLLFKAVPDASLIITSFCMRGLQSTTLSRITMAIASVHSIINSMLIIGLHKPYRDQMILWLMYYLLCLRTPTIHTIQHARPSRMHFTTDHGQRSEYDDLT